MDIERIRGWAWDIANKLIEAERGETRLLDKFMMDLRSATLPHDFANVIVNNMTVFKRSGINTGEIPFDLQYFASVTEFKEAKAVVIATFHNTQVLWSNIKELYNKNYPEEEIAKKLGVKSEFISKVVSLLKGGERG